MACTSCRSPRNVQIDVLLVLTCSTRSGSKYCGIRGLMPAWRSASQAHTCLSGGSVVSMIKIFLLVQQSKLFWLYWQLHVFRCQFCIAHHHYYFNGYFPGDPGLVHLGFLPLPIMEKNFRIRIERFLTIQLSFLLLSVDSIKALKELKSQTSTEINQGKSPLHRVPKNREPFVFFE